MAKRKLFWVRISLLVLATLFELDALYWLLFFLWRSAADPAQNALWHSRIYLCQRPVSLPSSHGSLSSLGYLEIERESPAKTNAQILAFAEPS